MKNSPIKIRQALSLLLAAVMLLSLTACAKQSPAAADPSAAPAEASAAPVAETPAVTTPDPDTPAGRAAARGLPAPPDIDLESRQYILNNSYNSITKYTIISCYGGVGGQGADRDVVTPMQSLLDAARAAGLSVYISVGYRDYEWLLLLYSRLVSEMGMGAEVAKVFLAPGLNEHQTGLAFDLTENADDLPVYYEDDTSGIEDTALYAWLCEHCAEYGFILRYPEGKENYYGTACKCPAHFRYVGVEAATYIMENDLCFEEFLLLYDPDAVFVPKQEA